MAKKGRFKGTVISRTSGFRAIKVNGAQIPLPAYAIIRIKNEAYVEIPVESWNNDLIFLPDVYIEADWDEVNASTWGMVSDIRINTQTIISLLQDMKSILNDLLSCCQEIASNTAPQ